MTVAVLILRTVIVLCVLGGDNMNKEYRCSACFRKAETDKRSCTECNCEVIEVDNDELKNTIERHLNKSYYIKRELRERYIKFWNFCYNRNYFPKDCNGEWCGIAVLNVKLCSDNVLALYWKDDDESSDNCKIYMATVVFDFLFMTDNELLELFNISIDDNKQELIKSLKNSISRCEIALNEYKDKLKQLEG